jgi:hypothetical protein
VSVDDVLKAVDLIAGIVLPGHGRAQQEADEHQTHSGNHLKAIKITITSENNNNNIRKQ